MASIANATIRIGATAEDVATAVSQAISHFQKLNSSVMKDASSSLHGIMKLAAGIGLAFGGMHLGAKMFGDMNEAVKNFERAEIAFEVMLKSSEKAKEMMKAIGQMEFHTPLKFTEITSGVQRLLSAQFDPKDVLQIFRVIGDAAAASGDSIAFSVERIVRSLSQMKARGHVTGEEIRELAHANVNARKFIAEGVSKDAGRVVGEDEVTRMIHDKQVSASTAMRAIMAGMNREFGGLQERIGTETFEGQFRRMASQAELAWVQMAKGMDKAFGIKKYLGEWVETFSEMRQNADSFAESLSHNTFIRILINSFVALKEIASTVIDTLVAGWTAFTDEVGLSSGALDGVVTNTQRIRELTLSALKVMSEAFIRFADGINIAGSAVWDLSSAFMGFLRIGVNSIAGGIAVITGQEGMAEMIVDAVKDDVAKIEKSFNHLAGAIDQSTLDKQVAASNAYFDRMLEINKLGTKPLNLVPGINVAVEGMHKLVKLAGDFNGELNESTDGLKQTLDKTLQTKLLDDADTPLQKLRKQLETMADDLMQGRIDSRAYESGVRGALWNAAKAQKAGDTNPIASVLMSGSTEAQKVILEAKQGQGQEQMPDLLKQLIREDQEQTRKMQELVDQTRNSGLVLVGI